MSITARFGRPCGHARSTVTVRVSRYLFSKRTPKEIEPPIPSPLSLSIPAQAPQRALVSAALSPSTGSTVMMPRSLSTYRSSSLGFRNRQNLEGNLWKGLRKHS